MRGRGGWVGAAVMLLSAFIVIGLIAGALFPAPQGPALSSFATTPDGVAGWAALLQRDGRAVTQLREPISATRLAPSTTLIVLASTSLSSTDESGMTRFVSSGGRLVIGGAAGAAYWETISSSQPPFASKTTTRTLGDGTVELLSNAASLENRELASGDNAELALRVAGPSTRPVAFLESIHGFGPATGLGAFPQRWWVAIVLLALAGGVFVLARAQRLGGPDPLPALLPSPRNAYIDAMAATLRKSPDRARLDDLASELAKHQPRSSPV